MPSNYYAECDRTYCLCYVCVSEAFGTKNWHFIQVMRA